MGTRISDTCLPTCSKVGRSSDATNLQAARDNKMLLAVDAPQIDLPRPRDIVALLVVSSANMGFVRILITILGLMAISPFPQVVNPSHGDEGPRAPVYCVGEKQRHLDGIVHSEQARKALKAASQAEQAAPGQSGRPDNSLLYHLLTQPASKATSREAESKATWVGE